MCEYIFSFWIYFILYDCKYILFAVKYIKKQKELIKFEHYGKLNAKLQKEAEMKALEDELYDNPLFNEYIQTQIELNELFSTMTHIIQYKVNKHLSE